MKLKTVINYETPTEEGKGFIVYNVASKDVICWFSVRGNAEAFIETSNYRKEYYRVIEATIKIMDLGH